MAKIISSAVGETFVSLTVGKDTITVDFAELSREMINKLALHGLKQKLSDSAASSLTDNERIQKIKSTAENLSNGVWNAGGGGTVAILTEAIARLKKVSIDEAQKIVDKLDDEQLKAVNKHAGLKLVIQQIKTERASERAKLSTDDSLDELLN